MFKILAVTNRNLCREPILERVEKLSHSGVDGIILREKDLPEEEYRELSCRAMELCRETGTRCILHTFGKIALTEQAQALHMPLPALRAFEKRTAFPILGASCHSLDDVLEAAKLGCSYVTLGHIFATDCKKGVPPRGIELLRQVCTESPIPVYAIGGIGQGNIRQVYEAGAAGACVMSGLLQCPDPAQEVCRMRQAVQQEREELL